MTESCKKKNNNKKELHVFIVIITILSLITLSIANYYFFKSKNMSFNLEYFLYMLPFNLIGLSFLLYFYLILSITIAQRIIE